MEDHAPSPLFLSAAEGVCRDTDAGWLWYCDEHDTHGNAGSEEEAEVVADAHADYWSSVQDDEDDRCRVMVWQRTPHERAQ